MNSIKIIDYAELLILYSDYNNMKINVVYFWEISLFFLINCQETSAAEYILVRPGMKNLAITVQFIQQDVYSAVLIVDFPLNLLLRKYKLNRYEMYSTVISHQSHDQV